MLAAIVNGLSHTGHGNKRSEPAGRPHVASGWVLAAPIDLSLMRLGEEAAGESVEEVGLVDFQLFQRLQPRQPGTRPFWG